jgi:hypothetical protein
MKDRVNAVSLTQCGSRLVARMCVSTHSNPYVVRDSRLKPGRLAMRAFASPEQLPKHANRLATASKCAAVQIWLPGPIKLDSALPV